MEQIGYSPNEVFVEDHTIRWEPKDAIVDGSPQSEIRDYEECEVGEKYNITLIERIIQVGSELEKKGIPKRDSTNQIILVEGELEKRLNLGKEKFLSKLSGAKLNPQESKIYHRLVGFNANF